MLWTDDMETGGDAANGLWTHFIDGGSTSITDWELGIPTWSQGPSASSVPRPIAEGIWASSGSPAWVRPRWIG